MLDYSDNIIPIMGERYLKYQTSKYKKTYKFKLISYIKPLNCKELGLTQRLDLINKNLVEMQEQGRLKEFLYILSDTGRLTQTVKIKVKKNCVPQIAVPVKIPLTLHNKVQEELINMTEPGIITIVNKPNDWISKMVVVYSSTKLRICLDARLLNKAIERSHYPIPTADAFKTNKL